MDGMESRVYGLTLCTAPANLRGMTRVLSMGGVYDEGNERVPAPNNIMRAAASHDYEEWPDGNAMHEEGMMALPGHTSL